MACSLSCDLETSSYRVVLICDRTGCSVMGDILIETENREDVDRAVRKRGWYMDAETGICFCFLCGKLVADMMSNKEIPVEEPASPKGDLEQRVARIERVLDKLAPLFRWIG